MATPLLERLRTLRIGYVPFTSDLDSPGDRRRFVYWARRRSIPFEIVRPGERYDLVVLTQAADLSVWKRYPREAGRVIYDLTDAYLRIPRTDLKGALRGAAKFVTRQSRHLQLDFRGAIEAVCRRADAVVCGSEEQARDVAPLCGNVHAILDMHELAVGPPKTDYRPSVPFRLVWQGLPENVRTFSAIAPALENMARRRSFVLDVVTSPFHFRWMRRYIRLDTRRALERVVRVPIRLIPWDRGTVGAICGAADLAVIPIPLDDPFYAGKPENKLLEFWKMGLPVVASATPAFVRTMTDAGLDLASRSGAEWETRLERLMDDEDARRAVAERGHAYAIRQHGEEATLRRWDEAIASVIG